MVAPKHDSGSDKLSELGKHYYETVAQLVTKSDFCKACGCPVCRSQEKVFLLLATVYAFGHLELIGHPGPLEELSKAVADIQERYNTDGSPKEVQ